MNITTQRLTMIAATITHLRAELSSDVECLARLIGAETPSTWPPDLFEPDDMERMLRVLEAQPDEVGWGLWYMIEAGHLVGVAAFDGPPLKSSVVMLGYSVLEKARGRGLAVEATLALTRFAFSDARVKAIGAETFPALLPSLRVLEKAGFRSVAGAVTPGAVRYQLDRE